MKNACARLQALLAAGLPAFALSLALAVALTLSTPPAQAQSCGPAPGGPPASGCGAGPAVQAQGVGNNLGAGNPVNVVTGNKYQREVDLPALPGVLGLEIVRHYNSAYSVPSAANGILGRGWRLSYESELLVIGQTIQIAQADGTRLTFARDPRHPSLCSSADPSAGQVLVERDAAGEHYTWVWNDGRRLSFDAQGRLTQILAPTGEFVSLQHDAGGHLLKVTDPQGRSLQLNYLSAREVQGAGPSASRSPAKAPHFAGVQSIDTPVGRFGFEYGSPLPAGSPFGAEVTLANLVRVTLPSHYQADQPAHPFTQRGVSSSALSRVYHYENPKYPTLLTGISINGTGSDERLMNQRISTYGYDASGKATLSVKGELKADTPGIEQVTLDFQAAYSLGGQPGRTVLRNSLGQTTVYTHQVIAGEHRLLEVRGAGCSTCGEANVRYGHDALGRLVSTTRLDPEGRPTGSTLTRLDPAGRPVQIGRIAYISGKPQAPQWRVRYEYDAPSPGPSTDPQATPRLPTQPRLIATPSVIAGREHIIRIDYNDAGQPTRIAEEGFSPLDDNGQPSPQGSLISRSTTYRYQRINGRSLLAEIDGPLANGPKGSPEDSDITRLSYDDRGDAVTAIVHPLNLQETFRREAGTGRMSERIAPDGIATHYAYTPDGQLARSERAGAVTVLQHNALGRISAVSDAAGRSIQLAYDIAGHPIDVSDAQGYAGRLTLDTEGQVKVSGLYEPGQTDPLRATYRWYDEHHRLTKQLQSDGRIDTWAYDTEGQRVEHLDGDDVLHVMRKNAADTLQARIDLAPDGMMRMGLRAQPREPGEAGAGHALLDDFGRRVGRLLPDHGVRTTRYDAADRPIEMTRADGSATEYRYDAAGRLTVKTSRPASKPSQNTEVTTTTLRYQGPRLNAHGYGINMTVTP